MAYPHAASNGIYVPITLDITPPPRIYILRVAQLMAERFKAEHHVCRARVQNAGCRFLQSGTRSQWYDWMTNSRLPGGKLLLVEKHYI